MGMTNDKEKKRKVRRKEKAISSKYRAYGSFTNGHSNTLGSFASRIKGKLVQSGWDECTLYAMRRKLKLP
jgi:hypothetical protein